MSASWPAPSARSALWRTWSHEPMRPWIRHAAEHPRGAAAVVFAALLPAFIGFAALSVDTSVIAVARAQLGTAADAAALAGALQLATENRVRGGTNLSAEITG